ncbi:hypothetical protein [Paenibacillus sp. PL2-23]|uniref:hypothetical protein n=1 Tax=Paenibacillus sp. PL2-23 TaxID=2100729 RepID=UPI0030F935F5
MRFVVVHSSQHKELQGETLLRQFTKENEKLEQAMHVLATERFACEHDAQDRLAAWNK